MWISTFNLICIVLCLKYGAGKVWKVIWKRRLRSSTFINIWGVKLLLLSYNIWVYLYILLIVWLINHPVHQVARFLVLGAAKSWTVCLNWCRISGFVPRRWTSWTERRWGSAGDSKMEAVWTETPGFCFLQQQRRHHEEGVSLEMDEA